MNNMSPMIDQIFLICSWRNRGVGKLAKTARQLPETLCKSGVEYGWKLAIANYNFANLPTTLQPVVFSGFDVLIVVGETSPSPYGRGEVSPFGGIYFPSLVEGVFGVLFFIFLLPPIQEIFT